MFRRIGRPSPALVLSLIALVAASSGFAVAAIPARDGTVSACYSTKNGAVRIVDERKRCKRRVERRLTWNQTGKDGAAGAQGPAGANGSNGTNGVNGSDAQLPPVEATRVVGSAGQPGFENGWSTSIGFAAPSFFKDRDGIVHLAGNSFKTSNAAFEQIFTLPAGYRPGAILRFPVMNGLTPGTVEALRVNPDGTVEPEKASVGGGVMVLDGVTFRAEQ